MPIAEALTRVLAPAFEPCPEFKQACSTMRWAPSQGHVPRGFYGAFGSPSEVELVLVFAEPGDPHVGESHTGLCSAYDYAGLAFSTGKDQFHRNVRLILDLCWPNLTFDEQMHRTWLTESVLCSATREGATVSPQATAACGTRYLKNQLALFSNAIVVALGSKAQARLRQVGIQNFLAAYAAAPPGCNFKGALPSWQQIPNALAAKRARA